MNDLIMRHFYWLVFLNIVNCQTLFDATGLQIVT